MRTQTKAKDSLISAYRFKNIGSEHKVIRSVLFNNFNQDNDSDTQGYAIANMLRSQRVNTTVAQVIILGYRRPGKLLKVNPDTIVKLTRQYKVEFIDEHTLRLGEGTM
jgi:hypothetical protein